MVTEFETIFNKMVEDNVPSNELSHDHDDFSKNLFKKFNDCFLELVVN